MIWGKTDKQRLEGWHELGDERVIFTYFPHQLKDGRWVWWEYVKCILAATKGGRYWSHLEVVKRGN